MVRPSPCSRTVLAALLAAALAALACTSSPAGDGRGPAGAHLPAGATPAAQQPTATPPPPEWTALADRLQAAIAGSPAEGRFAVAVMDLQTGHLLSVNGDRRQRAGCVVNFFLLAQVMRDVAAGRYPLEAVEELLAQTIWASDAVTARELYVWAGDGDVLAGVRRVRALIHGLPDIRGTTLDHPPGYVEESLGVSEENFITAEDAVRGLAALYHGRLLEEPWRTDLLDRLTVVYYGLNYLLASVPADAVSHKNGFYYEPADDTWVDNDIGVVRFLRDGREYAYAMAFLAEGLTEEFGDVALGQELAWLVWEYFQTAYPEA